VDVPGSRLYSGPAGNRVLAPGRTIKCCGCGSSRFLDELPGPAFSRARRTRARLPLYCCMGAESPFHCDWPLSVLSSRFQPRSIVLSSFHRATNSCEMYQLQNQWAIKHRADACAVTHRPFAPGEYYYTLLFHHAHGYRREDLSEEAWRDRNENIRPFSFWKSRYEPLAAPSAEPLPKENAEQLFRRLIASENPPTNACYVLAAVLERKRVIKQIKTEESANRRLLIYEHGETGDVFIVPDPRLRLDELENVQNEVAQLLHAEVRD